MKAHERVHVPMLAVLVVAAIASVAAAKAATAPKLPGAASELRGLPDRQVNSAAGRSHVSGQQIPDRAAPHASRRELVGRAMEDRQLRLPGFGRSLHRLPPVLRLVRSDRDQAQAFHAAPS